ncbi:hypothetical protein GCM10011607_12570 [Shewanella inventionis]|uniref:DUF2726 domain-containing protein n=1 Tax=Shewanella inventionis TaxID=1738770 RepID=A0ABQ1IVG9_9GAMM|nr:DUF2726 domain-containing protein [Shewanella inventionis]GGB53495.1 hypothetical protein GCM10011607_12570 [Shewanella inventionis]
MEVFYALIKKKDWSDIFRHVNKHKDYAKKNPIEWANICNILGEEFVRYASNEKPVLVKDLCQKYLIFVSHNLLTLRDDLHIQVENIGLEATLIEDFNAVPNYLKLCSKSEKVLNYKWKKKVNPETKKPSKTVKSPMIHWLSPLFKSEQELYFYQALRDIYPNLFIYPNVALKNIFDYDQLNSSLTKPEQDFYFKGVVDFVIYEPDGLQHPLYFFELDSKYHDTETAKYNDSLKNAIFDAAGIKLHRVRLDSRTLTPKHEFKQIIKGLLG